MSFSTAHLEFYITLTDFTTKLRLIAGCSNILTCSATKIMTENLNMSNLFNGFTYMVNFYF